jgi:hypothetical protein|nr:hypothetical protein [Candidatus Krumholzibacteria bacterium]
MDLAEVKKRLGDLDAVLTDRSVAEFGEFNTPHGGLSVWVSDRLVKKCRKGRVWKSPGMCTAMKNAEYGFDTKTSRSRGGADGLFQVDRHFSPVNAMMKKLFDQFLDKPDPLVATLENHFGVPAQKWIAVRLVSHHLRLLGFMVTSRGRSQLVLVDFDNEKGK